MHGGGRVIDNILTERLWRSLKYEEVHLKDKWDHFKEYGYVYDYVHV